jgi:hypothetical protein
MLLETKPDSEKQANALIKFELDFQDEYFVQN